MIAMKTLYLVVPLALHATATSLGYLLAWLAVS